MMSHVLPAPNWHQPRTPTPRIFASKAHDESWAAVLMHLPGFQRQFVFVFLVLLFSGSQPELKSWVCLANSTPSHSERPPLPGARMDWVRTTGATCNAAPHRGKPNPQHRSTNGATWPRWSTAPNRLAPSEHPIQSNH